MTSGQDSQEKKNNTLAEDDGGRGRKQFQVKGDIDRSASVFQSDLYKNRSRFMTRVKS